MMTRERFGSMLDPYIHQVYDQLVEKGDDLIPKLYGVERSELAEERVTGIGSTGLMQRWNGQVHYEDIDPLWDRVYRHEKFSLGLRIERDLWDDTQHNEIKDRVQRVSLSVHRTRQVHAHTIFNDAFAGGTLRGPDGVPLCANNHPLSPSNAATQTNIGTSALDLNALETTRVAMMNWIDDKGNRLLRTPDLLLVGPALERTARELVLSPDRPDTSNRAVNVRQGAYRVITLPLLEDSNNWFLADSQQMKLYLKWFDRRRPTPEREDDFDTETLKWKYVARYSFGFHHWTFLFGHNVP